MFPRTNTLTQPQADIEVADPPTDSISALAFCPTADFLAAASWNGEVRTIIDLSVNKTYLICVG